MSIQPGPFQKRKIAEFTAIETIVLTIWGFLFFDGLLRIYGIIGGGSLVGAAEVVASTIILYVGLFGEHDDATISGNAGPKA